MDLSNLGFYQGDVRSDTHDPSPANLRSQQTLKAGFVVDLELFDGACQLLTFN